MDGPYVVSVVAEHVPLLEVWVPEYPHHGDPVLLLSLVGETLSQLVGGGSCQQTCRQYLMKFRHQNQLIFAKKNAQIQKFMGKSR